MAEKKIQLGQFFTKESLWLKPQVIDFIKNAKCSLAYDPFAGAGDLLAAAKNILGFKQTYGLDIDSALGWRQNDSLINIPHLEHAIIITNPPYIAKQSASRKKIDLSEYFSKTDYDDIYLMAIDRMIEAQKKVVAIIPESFINSSYKNKNLLESITILEENPFTDTENPVCVACFNGVSKDYSEISIYKNDRYIGNLEEIEKIRIEPDNSVRIVFNSLDGWLGLRAVDSTNDNIRIAFDYKESIKYDWENRIKQSSRHFSLIEIDIPLDKRAQYINECNEVLATIREESADILLTPFMGNTKNGKRRRRLDFRLARAIMEQAYYTTMKGEKRHEQQTLLSI